MYKDLCTSSQIKSRWLKHVVFIMVFGLTNTKFDFFISYNSIRDTKQVRRNEKVLAKASSVSKNDCHHGWLTKKMFQLKLSETSRNTEQL